MNNFALGQYVDKDSFIHKLDARTKLFGLIILMVALFLIPSPLNIDKPYYSFIGLGVITLLIIISVCASKISFIKYLRSMKQILFLMMLTFVIQILSASDGVKVYDEILNFSIISISLIVLLLVLFIVFRKHIKFKMLTFIILLVLVIYILRFKMGQQLFTINLVIYQKGLYLGAFFVLRITLTLMLSTILTLTTKPTDLTCALEWYLHPLTYLKINVSVFAMLISLALRFIPTLFNESQKILKSQASRGVDISEGNLKSQISQIISLLIPMFVISYKRALDLADAMEARAYVPGAKRTAINVMKFKFKDLAVFSVYLLILVVVIVWRVIY